MSYNLDLIKEKVKNTKVLFFDLDGTLIDTEHLYFRFWKEACKYYGYEISDSDALSMRSREKKSAEEFLSKISDGLLDYETTRNKRIELMNAYLSTHPIQLKEGAVDVLKLYKSQNKQIYIVTANTIEKSQRIIKSINIEEFIDGVISAKDVKRGKPFPDVYLYACEMIKTKPNEVVVFEDSPNGLISSSTAGCFTVMVEDLTPFTKDMDYVDGAISSLKELL